MPASQSTARHHLRDSWLPAQVLLQPGVSRDETDIQDLDLAKMDEDPLIYFLTPTPSSFAEDEAMDFDMEFDAGIEDTKHPPQVVRSVSPSSLEGLSRPPPRPPTPPRSPATPDLDYDLSATPDEHEHYDYMDDSWPPPRRANPLSLPRRLKDKFRGHHVGSPDSLAPPPASSPYLHPSSYSSPSSSSTTSSRGRASSRSSGPKLISSSSSSRRSRGSTAAPARLSPHAWREPSPDVWSIEEETEQDMDMSGGGGSGSEMGGYGGEGGEGGEGGAAVDIPAAKPRKRVRFVLPAMDDVRAAY
ncbi:hypothetical protein C8A00DRAFT_29500 [Chaetomidium leptoderma]|uniref:Uncharacterized protein n=1 Tax=Chaetomidium leptoderma TaxID=669021 RepID=A0AAN6VTR5_9PEZI|nr:hypothetical protein C8A00DRAFT_29500 [Chaetomidium leptoderma]